MKKLLLPLAFGVLLFTACKENGPIIDFGPVAKDTSYVTTPETPQARVVVMEEFTGVKCPPCTDAHLRIKALQDQYGDKLVVLGIQAAGPVQAKAIVASHETGGVYTRHDNITAKGTELSQQLYGGLSAIPQAGVDRLSFNGSLLTAKNDWAGIIASRVAVPTVANVSLQSSFDAGTRKATIKVRVAYTAAVTKAQVLNLAIVENDVVDAQETGTGYEQNYTHQHVLRDILTASTGSTILASYPTKPAGLVYERTFVYEVNADWNPDNCHVIAYVSNNDGSDKETMQGAEVHLK